MRKRIQYALLPAMIAILSFLAYGCGKVVLDLWDEPSWDPPLRWGAEGSDLSMLVITQDGMYGYANPSGNVVIKPRFRSARPFYEGLAAVENDDYKFGYIDKTGKTVIPFTLYGAGDFHNGRALAGTDLGTGYETVPQYAGVIDTEGNILKQTEYSKILRYSGGMTAVVGPGGAYWLDSDYNPVAAIRTDHYWGPFSGGLAPFPRDDGKYIYIDKTGEQAFPGDYDYADSFSEGLAYVQQEDSNLFGYIDQTGQFRIPPQFKDARPFGDGMAWVMTLDNKWIIIDTNGKEIGRANSRVDGVDRFSEGLCAVYVNKMNEEHKKYTAWGFMDATGEMVIDFQYDKVTPFKNGIAQVLVDGKIGYIDKTGRYIWEPK